MKTIIQRKYNDSNEKWTDITLEQATHDLESGGYWKKGSTAQMLKQGMELWTPWASYRLKGSTNPLQGIGDSKIEQELRLEIKRHLDKCNHRVLPGVCKAISTTEGYQRIEQRIIQMLIKEQITPSAAIAQIEMEL